MEFAVVLQVFRMVEQFILMPKIFDQPLDLTFSFYLRFVAWITRPPVSSVNSFSAIGPLDIAPVAGL